MDRARLVPAGHAATWRHPAPDLASLSRHAVVPDTEQERLRRPGRDVALGRATQPSTRPPTSPPECGVHSIWAVVRLSDGAVTPILDQNLYLCGGVANSHLPRWHGVDPRQPASPTVLTRHFQDFDSCGVFVYETVVTTSSSIRRRSPQSVDTSRLRPWWSGLHSGWRALQRLQLGAPAGRCSPRLRPAANLATTSGTPRLPNFWDICYLMVPMNAVRRAWPVRNAPRHRDRQRRCSPSAPIASHWRRRNASVITATGPGSHPGPARTLTTSLGGWRYGAG